MKERALENRSSVVACSALKRGYRHVLRAGAPNVVFIHLDGPREVLLERLERREGHFMPSSLLESQLAILEPLGTAEKGLRFDLDQPPEAIASAVLHALERMT